MIHIFQVQDISGNVQKIVSDGKENFEFNFSWEEFLKRISQMAFKNRSQGLDRLHSHKLTTTAPVRKKGKVIPWTKIQQEEISEAISQLICE